MAESCLDSDRWLRPIYLAAAVAVERAGPEEGPEMGRSWS